MPLVFHGKMDRTVRSAIGLSRCVCFHWSCAKPDVDVMCGARKESGLQTGWRRSRVTGILLKFERQQKE